MIALVYLAHRYEPESPAVSEKTLVIITLSIKLSVFVQARVLIANMCKWTLAVSTSRS